MIELLYTAEPIILWSASIIAFIIFMIVWIIIFRTILQKINAKVTTSIPDEVENKIGIYAVSLLFWPAALVLGNHFLKKPETAQTGRTCIIIFLWFNTFIVILSMATVLVGVIYLHEIIDFLKSHGFL
jgi:hypothetical protein